MRLLVRLVHGAALLRVEDLSAAEFLQPLFPPGVELVLGLFADLAVGQADQAPLPVSGCDLRWSPGRAAGLQVSVFCDRFRAIAL